MWTGEENRFPEHSIPGDFSSVWRLLKEVEDNDGGKKAGKCSGSCWSRLRVVREKHRNTATDCNFVGLELSSR